MPEQHYEEFSVKIVLVGEIVKHRSFNGANKALPVLASSLHNASFTKVMQLDLERPELSIEDVLHDVTDAHLVIFAGCMTPQWQEIDEHTKQVFDYLQSLGRSDVPILVGGYATKGIEDIAQITRTYALTEIVLYAVVSVGLRSAILIWVDHLTVGALFTPPLPCGQFYECHSIWTARVRPRLS